MRLVFGKYWVLLLLSVIVIVIVIIAWLIQFLGVTSVAAQRFFNFIMGWAEALLVAAACLASVAVILTLRQRRLRQPKDALNRLHDWATGAVVAINIYRESELSQEDRASRRYSEIRGLIDSIKANSGTALADARLLGGELEDGTKRAVGALCEVDEKVSQRDDCAFEGLEALVVALLDVMISAFSALHPE